MDEAMISLLPNTSRNNLFREGAEITPAANDSFVIAYFGTYMHASLIEGEYAAMATECYRVTDTNIRLMARGASESLRSTFGDLITAFDCNDIRRRN
jgi:hypothetical protein